MSTNYEVYRYVHVFNLPVNLFLYAEIVTSPFLYLQKTLFKSTTNLPSSSQVSHSRVTIGTIKVFIIA